MMTRLMTGSGRDKDPPEWAGSPSESWDHGASYTSTAIGTDVPA